MTVNEIACALGESNKEAFVVSTKQQVGTAVLQKLTKVVGPKAPLMVRGYIDTPVGRVILANILAAAAVKYFPNNGKLLYAAEAATFAAMDEVLREFDVQGIVSDILDGITIDVPTNTPTTTTTGGE